MPCVSWEKARAGDSLEEPCAFFLSLKWRRPANQPVYFSYKAILVFPLVYVIHHLLDQLNSPICLFLSLINNDRPDHFAWGKLTTLSLQGNMLFCLLQNSTQREGRTLMKLS